MNSPVWSDSNYLKLWMYCLMKATHKEREIIVGNAVVTLEPGQFITGRESLADDLNKGAKPKQRLSEKTWYRYLENLERWQMLTINKTNKYSVISILKWAEYQDNDHQMSNKSPSDDHQMSTNKNVKNVKNDKEDTTTTTREDDAIVFYQNNFGSITPYVSQDLLIWLQDLGDELVIEAMKRALERNKKNWGYVKSILQSWLSKNIKTVEQAKAEETEFKNQQTMKKPFIPRKQQTEVVPDWFRKQKQYQSQEKSSEVDEQEAAELEAMLARYKTGGNS